MVRLVAHTAMEIHICASVGAVLLMLFVGSVFCCVQPLRDRDLRCFSHIRHWPKVYRLRTWLLGKAS